LGGMNGDMAAAVMEINSCVVRDFGVFGKRSNRAGISRVLDYPQPHHFQGKTRRRVRALLRR